MHEREIAVGRRADGFTRPGQLRLHHNRRWKPLDQNHHRRVRKKGRLDRRLSLGYRSQSAWTDSSYYSEDYNSIKLVPDKKSYRAGETAHVLAILPTDNAHLLVSVPN